MIASTPAPLTARLRLGKTLLLFWLVFATGGALSAGQNLRHGWLFHQGELDSPQAALNVDSFDGQPVLVPHDWAAAGPFDPEAHGGTGKLPWQGIGWYRNELELPKSEQGKRVYLDFDGVMAFPTIYLNGEEVGSWDYGYTPFRIDLTDHFQFGETNVLAVRVDTTKWSSRWYPGAGIYRAVELVTKNPIHVANWGLGITTDGDEQQGLPAENATLSIAIENHLEHDQSVEIQTVLLDPDGKEVAADSRSAHLLAGATSHRKLSLRVPQPRLWDIENPVRYTASVRILASDGKELDAATVAFGFRSFAFTADDGFHLNGRRVQLHGVNLHSDLGPLGMAFNRAAQKRQLEIMMEMGVNAIRTSHNPPAKELLELCDELGLLVWDEVFDKWAWTAGRDDFEPPLPGFAHRHIRNTILRDRNHPSVVTWSVGNEVNIGDKDEGITPQRAAMMSGFARTVDDSRPISMACHIPSAVNGENFSSLDIIGWNYARRYARFRDVYPETPIVYSESASALSTRGYYDPDLPSRPSDYGDGYKINSYDLNAAFWSDIPDKEFELMERDDYVAGEFVWTGFDYIGEPTPHDADSRSSYFGIVDLCGFLKDRFFLYRSHWRDDAETVHILPHWNWPDRVGKNVPVFVYTSGDSAELFLNGKSLGMRTKGDRPNRAPNLAATANVTASSGSRTSATVDSDLSTAWTADPSDSNPTITFDLGKESPIRTIQLDTALKEHLFAYKIESSRNGKSWKPVAEKPTRSLQPWEGTSRILHSTDVSARYLRVTFTKSPEDAAPGLQDFRVFAEPTRNDYYDITYDYRLRWDDVTYHPGELRAVAYRDGKKIGEASVNTVDAAVKLQLTPDRLSTAADSEDLVFITVEALDSANRAHPLAENEVTFSVSGAGEFVATGNGDPRSFVSFSSQKRKLFYGKALLIVRPIDGQPGDITIRAEAPGLDAASLQIQTR